MKIKIDKHAARAVLMAMWDDLARDLRFDDKPKGGVYDCTDEKVLEWLIAILEGRDVLYFIIDNNGFYRPCTIPYFEE